MPFKTQENDRRKVLYIPLALLFAVISSNCSTDGGIPLVGRAPVPIIDISSTNSWYLPGTTIMLDASNSFDPDGKIQSVQWRIIDGESTPLKNDTNPSTEFVVTHEMAGQTSVIELQVTDDSGNRANITTNLSFTQPLTPYAQFEYETVPVSGESSILDGNFSLDQYGSELFFKWDQTGGPDNLQMEIVDHGKLEVSVPFSLQPPEYEMTLTVSNISGLEKKTSRTFTPISPVTCQDCPSNNMELSDSGHIEMPDVTVIEGIFETTALVANEHDNLISLIDLATSEIIKKYDFFDVPSDILYVPEQDKAYVSLTNTPQLGVIE